MNLDPLVSHVELQIFGFIIAVILFATVCGAALILLNAFVTHHLRK